MSNRLLAAAAVLAAIACGGSSNDPNSLCNDFGAVTGRLTTKFAACSGGATLSFPTQQQCTAAVTQCNDNDRNVLRGVLNCVDGLPSCTQATITTWGDQFQACVKPIDTQLTVGCANAIGGT